MLEVVMPKSTVPKRAPMRRTVLLISTLWLCHCGSDTPSGDMMNPNVNAGTSAVAAGASGTAMAAAGTMAVTPPVGSAGMSGMATGGSAAGSSRAGRGGMMPSGSAGMPMTMMPPRAGMGAAGTGASGMGAGAAMGGAGSGTAAPAGDPTRSAGCGKTDVPPSGSTMLDVDGKQRQFIVKAPAMYDANTPHRLVFAWHGLGGTSMQIASTFYGLASRAMNSAIFIAPQGLPNPQQNDLAAWANTGDGDITFTRKMIDWAKTNYCIDEKRVFSIGMSNGGMMANIVGCELGGVIRGIAAMSGGGPKGYAMKACTGQTAVWISHGNKDNNVPFSYGQASRDYWAKANHCTTMTAPVMPANCIEYQGCDAGFPVQFCEFDGGHMVPSFAGEAAWNFFSKL